MRTREKRQIRKQLSVIRCDADISRVEKLLDKLQKEEEKTDGQRRD